MSGTCHPGENMAGQTGSWTQSHGLLLRGTGTGEGALALGGGRDPSGLGHSLARRTGWARGHGPWGPKRGPWDFGQALALLDYVYRSHWGRLSAFHTIPKSEAGKTLPGISLSIQASLPPGPGCLCVAGPRGPGASRVCPGWGNEFLPLASHSVFINCLY